MLSIPAPVAKLEARMEASNSLLCVGLDPDADKLPESSSPNHIVDFCCSIIDRTAEFACAFKLNTAFFEDRGEQGWRDLTRVFRYLQQAHPQHFTICDAKRADIGNTNRGYVRAVFDELAADSITLHPYLGAEALAPYLQRDDKVSIVLCRTSNPGAGELQDLQSEGRPLWEHVAARVSNTWNTRSNCMLVVGATWPTEMQRIRTVAPSITMLVPGIGAQGGDIDATVRAGLRADGKGLILASSRAILYADNPAAAARATRDAINTARNATQNAARNSINATR